MKKFIWVISLLMLPLLSFAQDKSIRKSPTTKNHKLWRKKASTASAQLVTYTQPKVRKGPKAKNRFARKYRKVKRTRPLETNTVSKQVKGPRAKNKKPGRIKTSGIR